MQRRGATAEDAVDPQRAAEAQPESIGAVDPPSDGGATGVGAAWSPGGAWSSRARIARHALLGSRTDRDEHAVEDAPTEAAPEAAPEAPVAARPRAAVAAAAEPEAAPELDVEFELELDAAAASTAAHAAMQRRGSRRTAPTHGATPGPLRFDASSRWRPPARAVVALDALTPRPPDFATAAQAIEAHARGPPLDGRREPKSRAEADHVNIPVVQAKLAVSTPGDAFEREADAVAERVMHGATPYPPAARVIAGRLQRAPPHARGPPQTGLPGSVTSALRSGGGRPLDATLRARIEPHVGLDLGHVRVREEPAAARDIGARAFTSGATIFLAAGASAADVALMAHEATHVAQQAISPVARATLQRDLEVTDLIPDWILDGVRSAVRALPGYQLLSTIVGRDLLTGQAAATSREELVEKLLTYGPFGAAVGPLLATIDVLGDVFAVITDGLAANDLTLARIGRDLDTAWDEFSITNGIAGNLAIVERLVRALLRDVANFVAGIADRVIELVRAVVADVAEPLLETPQIKPIWDLTKKILHYDPLRGEAVEAETVDILADFLRLIGQEQRLAQMQERGTLQETADWLDEQLATFADLAGELGTLFSDAWAAIQPANLPNLLTNLESLATRAFDLVQRVGAFGASLLLKVLELVKGSLLSWLSEHASGIPGFRLLTVILEQDPFTGDRVDRTARNLIRGFITLLPGGEATFDQLAESGVIDEAAERIESAMARLGISVDLITGLFLSIWDSVSLDDLLDPIGAFGRIIALFGEPLGRLVEFVTVVIEVVVGLVLRLMNFPTELLGRVIASATQAIDHIAADPVGFLLRMLEAIKLGFSSFFDHILGHLTQGLASWLFRGLGQLGIERPPDFSLASILNLVFQVLGLTVEHLWEKLGQHIGPERVAMIRGALDTLGGAWAFIVEVQRDGLAAIWRFISDQLGNLWSTLLQTATDWIMNTVVSAVTSRLLSLLDPTGIMAVINSAVALFNAIQSAIEYFRELLEIVAGYVDTLAAVAAGDVGPGAQMLEQGLANAVPIAIGFLAAQVGLGNIPEKIVEIIGNLRGLVDLALDWLIQQAVRLGRAALDALGLGSRPQEAAAPAATPAPVAGAERGDLQIDEGLSLDDGSHRLLSQPDPRELVLHSGPVLISSVPNPALQALYTTYVTAVNTYNANSAAFDDPRQAHALGGTTEQAPSGARLGKTAVDQAVNAIKAWVDANGVPPTDAPGLGDVRPYAQQSPRFATIPLWRLEAEHVVPNGYFNALLQEMRLRRIEHSDEYQQMSTVQIYERAAEWKTSGAGADEGDATIMRRIATWAAAYFAEIHADGGVGGDAREIGGHLMSRFESYVSDAKARTLRQIDAEQRVNGTSRGHPPNDSMGDFFAPKVADVMGRQLRLFHVVVEDRLDEAVSAGRSGY